MWQLSSLLDPLPCSPAPCHSSKKCGTPRLPRAPQVGCVKATVVKAKRLRSVSMERLPEAAEAKRPSRGGAQCQVYLKVTIFSGLGIWRIWRVLIYNTVSRYNA